jgi:hypothetical protein
MKGCLMNVFGVFALIWGMVIVPAFNWIRWRFFSNEKDKE